MYLNTVTRLSNIVISGSPLAFVRCVFWNTLRSNFSWIPRLLALMAQ